MKTIIFGSIAYDNLMNFSGKFSDSILPEQISNLNVSFLLPDLKREFGGCAANIAYNLNLLNDNLFKLLSYCNIIISPFVNGGNLFLL